MRAYLAIAILFLFASDVRASELRVPPGGKTFVDWLIAPEQPKSLAVDEIRYPKKKLWVLRSAEGVILAVMRVPRLRKGLEYNYGHCKISGVDRMDIIASVKHRKGTEWSSAVERAWVIDATTAEFKPVSPKGVVCRNEGYGV